MIIRSMTRSTPTYRQLINYILRNEEPQDIGNTDEQIQYYTHNLFGNTIDEWNAEFEACEAGRIRQYAGATMLNHDIVGVHPKDVHQLDEATLERLAYEYIDLKCPNSVALVAVHKDVAHWHLHVVSSGVQLDGKSARISKLAFQEVKLQMQERFPELTHSFVDHGKGRSIEKGKQWTNKDMLSEQMQDLLKKSSSKEDFLERAQEVGIELYSRKNEYTGVVLEGRKYRFGTLGLELKQFETPRPITNAQLVDKLEQGKGILDPETLPLQEVSNQESSKPPPTNTELVAQHEKDENEPTDTSIQQNETSDSEQVESNQTDTTSDSPNKPQSEDIEISHPQDQKVEGRIAELNAMRGADQSPARGHALDRLREEEIERG